MIYEGSMTMGGILSSNIGGLYTAPHSSVGLHRTPGDFPESTWSPGTFFFGGGTAKLWYQFYSEPT
jgi:hypothetical protein